MKIIHILLAFILLISTVNASDDSNFNYSGQLNIYTGYLQQVKKESTSDKIEGKIVNIQLNLDYYYKGLYIQATPIFYKYDVSSKYSDEVILNNFYSTVPDNGIFFRSFYMSYEITDKLTIGAGVLPFSNSASSKFNYDYTQDGEGIYMLNDNALTSIFIKYESDKSRTIFGIGTIDDILVPTGDYMDERLKKGSSTIFLINTYKKGKYDLITELLYNDIAYEDISVASVSLLGFNASYDDSEESGLSIYSTLGFSKYDAHSGKAKDKILVDAGIPSYAVDYFKESFQFEDKTYYGAATLLGFRQDFSLFNYEFFINSEWFHTYNDWSSGNQGNFYNGIKINQTFEISDDSYYSGLGYIASENLIILGTYQYIEYEKSTKIGAASARISHEDYIGTPLQNIETFMLQLKYKF